MISYRPKADCPPIPASLLADWFIQIHADWWNTRGQTLYGRHHQMSEMLYRITRGDSANGRKREPETTEEIYVFDKFQEFLADCFEPVDSQ